MLSGEADKDGDVIKNTQVLRDEISKIEQHLLMADNTESMRLALYDSIENENLALKPEHIALLTQMNEEPATYNPYTDDKRDIIDFVISHKEAASVTTKQGKATTTNKYKSSKLK